MDEENKTEWQPITLAGDKQRRIYVEVVPRGGREEVGVLESIPFEEVTELLTALASGIAQTLERVKPQKATVELGVEFGLEAGKLIALIAQGTAKANLKISLEWSSSSK